MLVAFLLLSITLSVLTTSKVAVIGIVVVLALYLMHAVRNKFVAATLLLAIVVGVYAALTYLSGNLSLLAEFTVMGSEGLRWEGSNLGRLNLVLAGIDMTISTYGLGVGGGNFSYLIEGGYSNYVTGNIIDPHNWWIEVLSQYGVFVFSFYIAFFAYVFALSKRLSHKRLGVRPRFIGLFVVAFFLSGFGSSSYMLQATNWLFVGTMLMVISTLLRERRQVSTVGLADKTTMTSNKGSLACLADKSLVSPLGVK